jgi:hypothetical protein
MEKFWRVAPWISRFILLPPTVIFTLIATRYLAHSIASAAAQGITLNPGLGVTVGRVRSRRLSAGVRCFSGYVLALQTPPAYRPQLRADHRYGTMAPLARAPISLKQYTYIEL